MSEVAGERERVEVLGMTGEMPRSLERAAAWQPAPIVCGVRKGNGELCRAYAVPGAERCVKHLRRQQRERAEKALEEARQRLAEQLVPKAMQALEELVENANSEGVRLQAANSILARTGIAEVRQSDIRADVTHHAGGAPIDDRIRRLLAEKAGEVVDAHSTEREPGGTPSGVATGHPARGSAMALQGDEAAGYDDLDGTDEEMSDEDSDG